MKSEIEIPDGWKGTKLENLCEILDHKRIPIAKSKRVPGSIPYYGATGLLDHVNDFIFDEELLLVGEDGADWSSFANTAYVIKGKSWVNNHAHVLRCSKCNSIFLRGYLNMNNLEKYITGATRGKLNQENLRKIDILIPKSEIEQQKIADILSKVDEQIDFTEKIIDKTEELKKGLMQKLLTKGIGHTKFKKTELGEIPEEWDIVKLGDCVEQQKEPILPSGEGKTTYVGLEHIDSGVSWLSRCGTDFSVKSLKYKFSENNILYGKLRPYLDKAVLTTKEGICSTDIIVIQSKENSLNEFILPILHSKRFLNYANSTTKGSNLPRTSWKSISKFIIPFPSLDEQKQIASILSKVDEHIQDNKKELKHLKELKKGLMQDILTGKVRVSV